MLPDLFVCSFKNMSNISIYRSYKRHVTVLIASYFYFSFKSFLNSRIYIIDKNLIIGVHLKVNFCQNTEEQIISSLKIPN